MRWCDPVSGETKIVKKFLWLPLEIDFETRWLEEATIKYRYCDIDQDWLPIEFLDNEGETK